jgi:hypothetical protein
VGGLEGERGQGGEVSSLFCREVEVNANHVGRLYYLTHVIGYDDQTAEKLIRERTSGRQRSPARQG